MIGPPLQSFLRFVAIDIHKSYLMIGAIDSEQRIVLQPRKVELHKRLCAELGSETFPKRVPRWITESVE